MTRAPDATGLTRDAVTAAGAAVLAARRREHTALLYADGDAGAADVAAFERAADAAVAPRTASWTCT